MNAIEGSTHKRRQERERAGVDPNRSTLLASGGVRSSVRRRSGFTLVELLIVISILAIVALVAVPAIAPSQPYRLDLAASEYADAIRHARGEALRTASPYGVSIEASQARLRVFRGDPGTMPPTPTFDVIHPLTKRVYELDLDTLPATAGVSVTTATSWSGTCSQPGLLGFDAAGTPRCGDPWAVLLQTSTLTLRYASHERRIVIDGETGRVSIQ